MSDYSIEDHIAYKMGYKAGQESQAARIAKLEAALKKIMRKTRHAHPMAYVSEYYRIAQAALEGSNDER